MTSGTGEGIFISAFVPQLQLRVHNLLSLQRKLEWTVNASLHLVFCQLVRCSGQLEAGIFAAFTEMMEMRNTGIKQFVYYLPLTCN